MTTEEFWKIYISKEGILKDFDIIYDFFSADLPDDFTENYDVGEVILEVRGHNETAKNFDRVLNFTELLQTKHPELYSEHFQYFDDFLVDYHCFHQNIKEAENAFVNFQNHPEQDFDKLVIVFKKLLFYQCRDLLDKTIINIYDAIKNSSKLIEGAEFGIAVCKYYINLEYYYNKIDEQNEFAKHKFNESLIPFDFNHSDDVLLAIEKGFKHCDFSNDTLIDSQQENEYILTIQSQFLIEMRNKKFPFTLSGRLWDKMLDFWEDQKQKKKQKPDDYFFINTIPFEKFLSKLSGDFFLDNKSEMIAVLWGSVYIYDFLHLKGLINQETYNSFKESSKILKGKVIGQFTSDLWNSNFIHTWIKPDSISDIEFKEEDTIFRKSISLKPIPFTRLRSEIADELKNIGELSEFIIQGGKNDNTNSNSLFDKLFDSMQDTTKSKKNNIDKYTDTDVFQKIKPITNVKKVGRNDICSCGSGKKYKKCCENK